MTEKTGWVFGAHSDAFPFFRELILKMPPVFPTMCDQTFEALPISVASKKSYVARSRVEQGPDAPVLRHGESQGRRNGWNPGRHNGHGRLPWHHQALEEHPEAVRKKELHVRRRET